MTLYIIIILATIIILGLIFGRKRHDEKSDYQPEVFIHSGHNWVFNGILDIDHPPLDNTPFLDYEQPMQLVVKKGFVHYDLDICRSVTDDDLGLFHAEAQVEPEGGIVILREGKVVAKLVNKPAALAQAIREKGGRAEAYAFIASKGKPTTLFGEACIRSEKLH